MRMISYPYRGGKITALGVQTDADTMQCSAVQCDAEQCSAAVPFAIVEH
jgi:hypothetical protein